MTKTLSIVLGVLIALVVIIGAVLIFTPGETTTKQVIEKSDKGPIKIGSVLPLTGDAAGIGQNTRAAIEIALEEVNAKGGINGRPLEIIFEDGKCGPKDATSAGNKLMNIDNVPVIVGGLCSSETIALAPTAESTKTVLMSPCSSNPDITNAGDYVFRAYPSDAFQGVYAADYAYDTLEARKSAILYCLSDWCVAIKDTFKKGYKGEIVAEEAYEQDTKDLRTQLTKIKAANPDLIYFVGYTEASIVGLRQADELGLEGPFFGGDAWDDPKIWESTKGISDGAMYSMVYSDLSDEFKSKMQAKTGGSDITICSPQGYDVVKILADVMRKAGTDSEAVKNELYKVKNFPGVSGSITLDENGDTTTANYAVKTVLDGKAVLKTD